jgi:hypothetical protein
MAKAISEWGTLTLPTLLQKIFNNVFEGKPNYPNFAFHLVVVAQLVRASDCGSEGRGFEPHHPPGQKEVILNGLFFHIN